MPYRHAHWWLLALFPLAALAFWPTYLSQMSTSEFEFHAHGVTATLWLILLVAQSWAIHGGRRKLHRLLGTASLALFPLFMAGGAAIFLGMARRLAADLAPFYTVYAARLAWIDGVSVAAFALCFHQGLRHRSRVRTHSAWMLATVIFLVPPMFGRLLPPAMSAEIGGFGDLWKLVTGFHLANLIAAGIAFFVAWRSGRDGWPFVLAGLVVLLGGLLFQTIGGTDWWQALFLRAAGLPTLPVALAAGLFGVAVAASGWISGRRPA
jgi:hypothetical protein